jgi:hypothetical protein
MVRGFNGKEAFRNYLIITVAFVKGLPSTINNSNGNVDQTTGSILIILLT